MHFRPLLLLGTATTLFLPSLAEFKGAAIRWCNESPPDDQPNSSCIQTVVTLDQCNLIPDSNAKGDWSSSAVVKYSPRRESDRDRIECRLYLDNQCKEVDDTTVFNNRFLIEAERYRHKIFRSYLCIEEKEYRLDLFG
ncbi:hypothetical protein LTS08_004728 [Lithohypha guttulata]|uniref:Uncharacterized protein n=1 Tax=Lithohypha guttulata TaxID=1690604 RepID=A0AAN7Y7Q4_9EURO|nr:hypothetical protein LTR51_006009 [Lithohypha guttulata]KAK5088213.1 hypothetical protein LTR05_002430 [Lithohypha guttulata]KAK5101122.1 hypothetical protein LTS08_004728 [Lithohypha guttulata]